MSIDEHVEELASALGVDEAEVRRDLENLLEYSVPIEEAKQSLRRKYGSDQAEPGPVSIEEISVDDTNVTVTGRVLTVGKRSIRYEGEDQIIFEGMIADESGTISYTAWNDFDLNPGDTISISGANIREWEGEPELNLGQYTTVSHEEEPLSVPYEIGGDALLSDLEPGDRGMNIEVRVLDEERRTINGRAGETEIISGVLGDTSARLPFTDWEPHTEIVDDACIRIENIFVREFRGVPSVNISEFSVITPVSDAIEVVETPRLSLGEAIQTGGAFDIELTGHVVGLRNGSGLIKRCPECSRVIQKGQCRRHGEVDGVDDLRVKAIVDDGTGTVTAVLDETLTEEVYGGDVEQALDQAREAMNQDVVTKTIADKILGREYRIRGNLSVDEFGATLNATEFELVTIDPVEQATELLEAVQ